MGIIKKTSELQGKAPKDAKWLEHLGNAEWIDLRLTPEEAKKAINEEFDKFKRLKVWTGVLPSDITQKILNSAITCSAFLKEKFAADGSFDRMRSRVVGGGHMQQDDASEDNSSPTPAWESVCSVVAASLKDMPYRCTGDVPSAYLNEWLKSTVPGKENEKLVVYMIINRAPN